MADVKKLVESLAEAEQVAKDAETMLVTANQKAAEAQENAALANARVRDIKTALAKELL